MHMIKCLCYVFDRYEGTGRSLSLKLVQQLRQQAATFSNTSVENDSKTGNMSGRKIFHIFSLVNRLHADTKINC